MFCILFLILYNFCTSLPTNITMWKSNCNKQISYRIISYHINYCFLQYGDSAILGLLLNHCSFPDRVGIFLLSAHLTGCEAKSSNLHQLFIPMKTTVRALMVRLASSLRLRWVKPPLTHTPSWCGLLIRCGAIFIFTLLYSPPPCNMTLSSPSIDTHTHTHTHFWCWLRNQCHWMGLYRQLNAEFAVYGLQQELRAARGVSITHLAARFLPHAKGVMRNCSLAPSSCDVWDSHPATMNIQVFWNKKHCRWVNDYGIS